MKAHVVLLPKDLTAADTTGRVVVVFDVLRATTSMLAALATGVKEIRVFDTLDAAAQAASSFSGPRLLCGERQCLCPPGFDLGNSPAAFTPQHAGQTLFMCTTNGTRAIVAAQQARMILIGALTNASAMARRLHQLGSDFTLLCAGTNGQIAMEDVLGAGAVLQALESSAPPELASDTARMALRLFQATRADLLAPLRQAQGGQNVIHAGLASDLEFAARLDATDQLGVVHKDPLRVLPG